MIDRRSYLWQGRQMLPQVENAIACGDTVEIMLPPDTHHALFMHLYPEARSCDSAAIDTSGGAQLLRAMATVAGLADLARFAERIERAGYGVELTSPPPTLVLLPPHSTAAPGLRLDSPAASSATAR